MINTFSQAVNEALRGNNDGFTYLYENTYYDKYYIALKYMGNEQDAQDVLQDAYVNAWSKLNTLDDPEKFPAWLGMIVANTAKNALVKKKPMLFSSLGQEGKDGEYIEYDVEDDYIGAQPEMNYTIQETQQFLYEMLNSLSEEQKMCILMYHIEDMKIKDIAEALGCSENTVKSRLTYGRNALRAKCEEMKAKGYRLYTFAPIPFVLYLIKSEASAYGANYVAVSAANRMAANAGAVASVNAGQGMAGNAGAVASVNAGQGVAAMSGANAVGVATKVGSSIAVKIAVGCTAVVLIGAGIVSGVFIANKKQSDKITTEISTSSDENTAREDMFGEDTTGEDTTVEDTTDDGTNNEEIVQEKLAASPINVYGMLNTINDYPMYFLVDQLPDGQENVLGAPYDVLAYNDGYVVTGTIKALDTILKDTGIESMEAGDRVTSAFGNEYVVVSNDHANHGNWIEIELQDMNGNSRFVHSGLSGDALNRTYVYIQEYKDGPNVVLTYEHVAFSVPANSALLYPSGLSITIGNEECVDYQGIEWSMMCEK